MFFISSKKPFLFSRFNFLSFFSFSSTVSRFKESDHANNNQRNDNDKKSFNKSNSYYSFH